MTTASTGRYAGRKADPSCRAIVVLGLTLWSLIASAGDDHYTPIRSTQVLSRDIEIWDASVGQIEARAAPTIAAEVVGRVVDIKVDAGQKVAKGDLLARLDPQDFRLARLASQAEIKRLSALLRAQQRQVRRLQALERKKLTNEASLDEAVAKLDALDAQLAEAHVLMQEADRKIAKTRIRSPVSGRVDERFVAVGDYVKVGAPMFHIATLKHLRVRLPYPESMGAELRVGLPVRLNSPTAPERTISARITQVRPVITRANRAIQVLIDVDNPGDWEPGASVSGEVLLARHEGALMVPEVSVVRRPVGTVVYLIEEGVARQRRVATGLRQNGEIEIIEGLSAGQRIATDGAGFLTDGARVRIR